MNELKANITPKEYLEYRLEKDDSFKFEILALAHSQKTSDKTWGLIRIADKICKEDDFTYQQIRDAIAIADATTKRRTEFTIHNMFKEKFSRDNEMGYQITQIKNDPRYIPDVWVAEENHILPVEIKLKEFDKKALEQLQRYIDFYDAKGGIAVGEGLTVKLPENILFIPIKELETKDVS